MSSLGCVSLLNLAKDLLVIPSEPRDLFLPARPEKDSHISLSRCIGNGQRLF